KATESYRFYSLESNTTLSSCSILRVISSKRFSSLWTWVFSVTSTTASIFLSYIREFRDKTDFPSNPK
ncbi:MAG: hypothetical protein AAB922_07300, partial [Patescibacteria group bacterium]